jgi:hypothetical protein
MKLTFLYTISIFSLLISMLGCSTGLVTKVKIKVVDQVQIRVLDARVEISFHGGGKYHDLLTDDEGLVEVIDRGLHGQAILITKDGYYDSAHRTGNGDQDITLELREIKKPIAMYVSTPENLTEFKDREYGYDLLIGDFIAPQGKGTTADLLITTSGKTIDIWNTEFYFSIRFSNPLDGLVPFFITDASDKWRSDIESFYKSDYLAPNSGFIDEWDFHRIRKGKKKGYDTNMKKTRNYYFRVRTKVDEDGNIESAHYGKIYGEFPRITHYFNPTSNDRNVEFELLKNLSRDKIFKP